MARSSPRHYPNIDSSGRVVVKYKYDAWGNHTISGSNISLGNINPFRYRGYYYDTEFGLYYLQSRYYDSEVGRFISADDVSYLNPESIFGLNLYAYCGNNPVNYVDPTGHFPWLLLVAGLLFFTPVGGTVAQTAVSTVSYVGMAAAAIFDSNIRSDMNAIGWNPFNADENAVLGSNKVSFYKGMPVYRTNMDRSGTFYAILLNRSANKTDLKHERGHGWQSMMMGVANYGLMIGLPSLFEWSNRSYYERPWEITADILGGVARNTHTKEDITRGWWYLGVSSAFSVWGYFFLFGEY